MLEAPGALSAFQQQELGEDLAVERHPYGAGRDEFQVTERTQIGYVVVTTYGQGEPVVREERLYLGSGSVGADVGVVGSWGGVHHQQVRVVTGAVAERQGSHLLQLAGTELTRRPPDRPEPLRSPRRILPRRAQVEQVPLVIATQQRVAERADQVPADLRVGRPVDEVAGHHHLVDLLVG
ncbi:MAG TPA: hypothetical protein VF168_03715 [Trueperaceae bacterium]